MKKKVLVFTVLGVLGVSYFIFKPTNIQNSILLACPTPLANQITKSETLSTMLKFYDVSIASLSAETNLAKRADYEDKLNSGIERFRLGKKIAIEKINKFDNCKLFTKDEMTQMIRKSLGLKSTP